MARWMDEQINGQINGRLSEWMGEWRDGLLNQWVDIWIEERMYCFPVSFSMFLQTLPPAISNYIVSDLIRHFMSLVSWCEDSKIEPLHTHLTFLRIVPKSLPNEK